MTRVYGLVIGHELEIRENWSKTAYVWIEHPASGPLLTSPNSSVWIYLANFVHYSLFFIVKTNTNNNTF